MALFNREKSIKLTEYFKIVKPNYKFLKLTPANSIRNYNSDKIAHAAASLFKKVNARIKRYEKQFFYEAPSKVSYFIYIEKGKVEFYFIVPDIYESLLREKINDTWKGITIETVESIPQFTQKALYYALNYTKENALSLSTDKRTNTLLSSNLNVIDVMEEGDRVGIFYNLIPSTQFTWRAEYKNTISKIQANQPVDRNKMNAWYITKFIASIVVDLVNSATDALTSFSKTKEKESFLELALTRLNPKELTLATKKKENATILEAQILVISESDNEVRKENNARSLAESFKTIEEDNSLSYKKIKRPKTKNVDSQEDKFLLSYRLNNVETNKMSTDECQNLISLPGKELLEDHNCIEKIDTLESKVPEELQEGVMCIGTNTCKGKPTKAYLSTDKEYKNLTLCVVGPTRAGKTTLFQNLNKDALNNNECNIIFDFCGECEFSDEIAEVTSKDKILTIDTSDTTKLQGLGYNEIREGKNTFETYRNTKIQVSQLITLVNSINGDDSELKARMERYLESAALVVFISNGPIKDVFGTLKDHRLRHKYINSIPKDQEENLEEYVLSLQELDEYSKATKDNPAAIVGTKISNVQGILNRVNKLKQNAYMELMLKADCKNNIDLVEEIQKNQLICIKIPESAFSTETEKDIYCTYWISKIWLALQIRKWEIKDRSKHTKVNIFVDELSQVDNCTEFIRSKLSQMAKFSAKMIISCHFLKQIPIIRNELKAANTSYMMISGCNIENYKEMKTELYPYTEEDLLNLKRYHSLNYIKTKEGYSSFITALPRPIK